jgi:hypothetical protein
MNQNFMQISVIRWVMLIMSMKSFLKSRVYNMFCAGLITRQTNGKIEKFHDLYINHRDRFASLEDMIVWYNEEKPHGALNLDIAETLSQAFIRKMRPEVWLGLAVKIFNW